MRRGKASHILKEMYNFGTNRKFDEFADFIAIHYAFTQRRDTKYWEDIFNKDWLINWNCVDHINYVSNPQKRLIGTHKIYDYYMG